MVNLIINNELVTLVADMTDPHLADTELYVLVKRSDVLQEAAIRYYKNDDNKCEFEGIVWSRVVATQCALQPTNVNNVSLHTLCLRGGWLINAPQNDAENTEKWSNEEIGGSYQNEVTIPEITSW